MRRQLRLIASALLLMLVVSVSTSGWNDSGHMTVAYIAYKSLTPQARARVDELVSLNPRVKFWEESIPANTSASSRRLMLFMKAATWADEIKSDSEYHADGPDGGNLPPTDDTAAQIVGYDDKAMHKYWHFVDVPFSPDNTPLQNAPVPNAGTQIPLLRDVLSSTKPDAVKSYALVWLLHLVGDIHQPLHCASRFTHDLPKGDAGGNFITVCDPQCGKRLHAFWDGLLGTSSQPGEAMMTGLVLPKAVAITESVLPKAAAGAPTNLHVSVWIDESFAIAKTQVYRQPPIGIGKGPFTLTSTYRTTALGLARKRVALAGARLAQILNTELK